MYGGRAGTVLGETLCLPARSRFGEGRHRVSERTAPVRPSPITPSSGTNSALLLGIGLLIHIREPGLNGLYDLFRLFGGGNIEF
jgi:hypothetical protein